MSRPTMSKARLGQLKEADEWHEAKADSFRGYQAEQLDHYRMSDAIRAAVRFIEAVQKRDAEKRRRMP